MRARTHACAQATRNTTSSRGLCATTTPLADATSMPCYAGSDHALDDEDGSDSEVSMRCEFVDSMAAESRSVQSDEGATSADSDACATD